MKVSIMVTTRNRLESLFFTLDRLERLDPPPNEILVTADGCDDGTVDAVNERTREEKEVKVRLLINEVALGSVASRDRMMREADGDLVVSLDDDSYPEQSDFIERLRREFVSNTALAVLTFPQRSDEYPDSLLCNEFGKSRAVRTFANSGACLRSTAYEDLPGFERIFFHMYEEPDFALQCIANGWEVRLSPEITIRHHWTPNQRSELRNHHRHARNEAWSTFMRCPFPYALFIALFRVFSQARFAASRGFGWLLREPVWWWQALIGIPQVWRRRNPVTWEGYRKWLSLPDP